jgi:UDP-glucose 4-epimerase
MLKSLVTGGAGFIGSHVAAQLLQLGHAVTVLDDLSGGQRAQVPADATFVEGSILDNALIQRLFEKHQFDYVYHLAAYAAEGLSHFIKRFNYHNNLLGSVNLINASVNHNVKCFVFTSSIAVYGSAPLPMSEDTIPMPEDSYGIAKYAVERELNVSHAMFGLNYVIFRPHNVYGEHQNIGDKYRNVIGIFMNQLMQNQPLTIFGDGQQTRAFTYIGDIAPLIARAVTVSEAHNQTFNVGADTPCAINELARLVMQAMGTTTEVVHLPARNEVAHAYANQNKLRRVFGVVPETPLEEGLARMARWVKAIGARHSKNFEAFEITKNMPPHWLNP